MPNFTTGTANDRSGDDPRARVPAARTPVQVSLDLPLGIWGRGRGTWLQLLHAVAIPLFVAGAVYGLHGELSVALLVRLGPVMGLLIAAYAAASALHVRFDRFPFVHRVESALLSASLTLGPAGGLLAVVLGPPSDTVALLATGGTIGWFLLVHALPPPRASQLLVVPGGAANRLLALPEVSINGEADRTHATTDRAEPLDGIVADLHDLPAPTQDLLAEHGAEGAPVYHADPLYRRLTARIPLGALSEASLEPRTSTGYRVAKRILDLLIIGATLPVTLLLIAATALAIRVGSRGPVLFWQERMGRHGEPFQMAKFRSMYVGHEGEERAVFAAEDDDRVTPVGQVIRQFRIDELPQIWNVLKGEMSLIGPRPEQVGLAENFGDALQLYHARHLVRPGITGWAQVLQGYAADVDETRRKLEHDLYYVEHRSVLLDLLIVYLTVKTLLTGGGAR